MGLLINTLEVAAGLGLVFLLLLADWSWQGRLTRRGVRALRRRYQTHKGISLLPPPPPPPPHAAARRSTAI